MLEKIKPEELVGKGVIGLPDTPKLTAEEMQKKFEETAREVIVPKYNALVEALLSAEAAGLLGAADPENGEKSTVQAVLAALLEKIENKKDELETAVRTVPQELTAEQQEQARENIAAVGQDEYISWFEKGEGIPKNADLDAYTTPGKFYAQAASIVNSLANKPEGMNSNFCMFVFERTSNTQSQLLVTLSGKMYIRSKSTGSWYGWVEYATEKEVASLLEGVKEELLAQIVHADWNENDPLSRAYVKNRPVYLAPGEVLAKEQEVMVANDELCAPVEGDFALEPGRMYEVTLDGVPYDCFAYTASVTGSTVLGNLGVNPDANMEGENKGSGEPFAVITGYNAVWLYTEKQGEFRIKIVDQNGVGDRVVIAEEYRDVLGVQPDWNQDDPTKTAYIRNRPFYIEPGAVLVKEQVVETNDAEFSGKIAGSVALEVGKQYKVIFEGKTYKCTAYETSDTGDTALGNLDVSSDAAMYGDNMGADEPFAIIYIENSGLWLYTEKAGSYTVEIVDPTAEGERVVIDKRFVGMLGGGQADWNQNDPTAPDYIKNRPFYGEKEGIAETITTEDGGGYGYGEIAGELLLEAGKTYTVTLDGKKYECKAYTIGNRDGADAYAALGNSALAVQDMPEAVNYPPATDEPFAIVDWGGGDLSLYTEATGTYAVELGEKGSFVRMDEKYLPPTVLLATAQKLTEDQQAQARKNIGALGAGEVKSAYETAQEGGYLGTEEEFAAKLATDFIDWFGVGASIPEGADLNNYKTNGKYYVGTEARARTILNRPDGMNTNFCMWVFQRTTASIYSQLLLTLHGKLYLRSSNSSKWNAWVAYTNSAEIEALTQQIKAELLEAVGKPDWAQNDPSVAGYIENRPFYVTDETAETTAEEQVVDVPNALYEGEICGTVEMAGLLEENQVYEVTFNGTKYRCTAYECAADDYVILGNTDINADISMLDIENKGNGEPFCILHGSATSTTQLYTETVGEYLISIRRLKVMRLEEKFMPESVDGVVLRSSTPFSEKKFRITVNDNGIISVTPV